MGNATSEQISQSLGSFAENVSEGVCVESSPVLPVKAFASSRPYVITDWPTKYGAPLPFSRSTSRHTHYHVRRNLPDLMAALRTTVNDLQLGPLSDNILGLVAKGLWHNNGEIVSVSIDIYFSAEPEDGVPEYLIEFKRLEGPRFQTSDMAFQIAKGIGLEPPDAISPTAHFFKEVPR